MNYSHEANWNIENDFQQILEQGESAFKDLKNGRVFLTGGTGFIGRWLLESFRFANVQLELNIKVVILTRQPKEFQLNYPELFEYPAFEFVLGNINQLPFEKIKQLGPFSHLIHAATDASAELNENNPIQMFETVVGGTKQVLDLSVQMQIPRILYLSSGAVYGQQPKNLALVDEQYMGAPDCLNPRNAYAEGKRASEMLCAIYAKQHGCSISSARIFAQLGPFLNLNIHFAAGNFIRDALSGKKIIINSDGRPERSYLYPTDLIVWLLMILFKGAPGESYNVGSQEAVSIAQLAALTSNLVGNAGYEILGLSDSGWNPGRYVPSNAKICRELGVRQTIQLEEAILRTASWNRGRIK